MRACFQRTNALLGLGVMLCRVHGLDPARVIFVGDMKTDATFAKRCGFPFAYADDFFRGALDASGPNRTPSVRVGPPRRSHSMKHHLPLLPLALALGCAEPDPTFSSGGAGSGHCEAAQPTGLLSADGLLADADWFADCEIPPAGEGDAAFTGYEGATTVVNGGSTALDLAWEGAPTLEGRLLVVWVRDTWGEAEPGFFVAPLGDLDDPADAELYISSSAREGQYTVSAGIAESGWEGAGDSGLGAALAALEPGSYLEIPLQVIAVRSGAVQVNVNWDSAADVDLYVTDPSGETIFYAHPQSASGGYLDLDSNAGCSSGASNENIFWLDDAPSGEYLVEVDYWSDCGVEGETTWRATVLLEQEPVSAHEGVFTVDDARFRFEGGSGIPQQVARTEVTTFVVD